MHGATATLDDSASGNGWLDIRGNLVASGVNRDGSWTNVMTGKNDADRKVNNATINVTLNNKNSKLFGNVYERHRLSEEETIDAFSQPTENDSYGNSRLPLYFDSWLDYIKKQEANGSLGGQVNLTLANGATWYPLRDWYGWDTSVATEKFEDPKGTLPTNNSKDQSSTNRLDQYNLYRWENGQKVVVNKLEDGYDQAINDQDLIEQNGIGISYVDREGSGVQNLIGNKDSATVDNGIYRLSLNEGGVVDTRFMRMDFGKIVGVKETDENFHDWMVNITQNTDFDREGIKTLRIQELNGSGNFSIYVKDKQNHDILIVDKAENSTNNTMTLWNLHGKDGGLDPTMGIKAGDVNTFIQLARVDKDMKFNDEVIYKLKNSVYEWNYKLVADEDETISKVQGNLMHEGTNNWYLVSAKKQTNENVQLSAIHAYNVPYLFATKLERLNKRMGEARYAAGHEDGAWVRFNHTRDDLQGYEAKASMIEVGYDKRKVEEDGVKIRGGAISYLDGSADYHQYSQSNSDTKRYRATLYHTWLGDNGSYLDLVGRVGWYDSDFQMNFMDESINGEMDLWAASASIESGHKFSNEKKWFIEPQLQLQYTYLGDSDYISNNGIKTEMSNVDSLVGRAGFRVGKDALDESSQDDKATTYYARADVIHEFMGDRQFRMQGSADHDALLLNYDGKRTWYDVGLGITRKFNKDGYLFVDVERQFGSDINRIWEFNVGVRYHF